MDPDDFLFASDYPIDKVLLTGETTVVNDGNTKSDSLTYQSSKIVTGNVANTTGKTCHVRYVWSIDGVNWQSSSTHLIYSYTVSSDGSVVARMGGLQGAVSVGVNNSNIAFRTANGSHGNVSISSTGSPSYTTTSRTFRIKYALYSME